MSSLPERDMAGIETGRQQALRRGGVTADIPQPLWDSGASRKLLGGPDPQWTAQRDESRVTLVPTGA